MSEISSIIVEDNKQDVSVLEHTLAKFCSEVKVIGRAKTVSSALSLLNKCTPDIIFLDMELGGESSFKIFEAFEDIVKVEVIIISAYTKYAVKAFEHLVTGYVLKPLRPEKLMLAVKKAKKNLYFKMLEEQKNIELTLKPIRQLAVASLKSVQIVMIQDVFYLEADGRYTVFHLKDSSTILASKNLGEYEKLFVNNFFFRIHHCFLVNMNYAANLHKKDGFYLRLTSNKLLSVSKRRVTALYRFLNLK